MAERRDSAELFWVSPDCRGIIPLKGFHVPRRLARTVRGEHFTVTANRCFADVMRACAAPAPGREQSWINDEILSLYGKLYERGQAHSIECWCGDTLVGGLYGVQLGAAFFGESMFSRERDASKVALVHLVARLIAGGFKLLDAQFLTSHLARFGATEIPREEYLRLLDDATAQDASIYWPAPSGNSGSCSSAPAFGETALAGAFTGATEATTPGWFILQLITQTS